MRFLNGALVLLEQGDTGVTASITEEWNEAKAVGLLCFQIGLDISKCQLAGAGNANVGQLKAPPLRDLISDLHSVVVQIVWSQTVAGIARAVGQTSQRWRDTAYRRDFGKEVAVFLQFVSQSPATFDNGRGIDVAHSPYGE